MQSPHLGSAGLRPVENLHSRYVGLLLLKGGRAVGGTWDASLLGANDLEDEQGKGIHQDSPSLWET